LTTFEELDSAVSSLALDAVEDSERKGIALEQVQPEPGFGGPEAGRKHCAASQRRGTWAWPSMGALRCEHPLQALYRELDCFRVVILRQTKETPLVGCEANQVLLVGSAGCERASLVLLKTTKVPKDSRN
jgi:hypothetical protein